MASENVQAIVDAIKELKVMELSELVSELEEEFDVTASAPMAVAAAPVAGGGDEAAAGEDDAKSEYDVVLESAGDAKIQVIKVVRDITGLGLKDAKALVDGAPGTVKEAVPAEEAENIKSQLEEAGAKVELK